MAHYTMPGTDQGSRGCPEAGPEGGHSLRVASFDGAAAARGTDSRLGRHRLLREAVDGGVGGWQRPRLAEMLQLGLAHGARVRTALP